MLKLQYYIAMAALTIANKLLIFLQGLLFSNCYATNFKNICIYKTGNIGDTLCAIPALYKVRQKYPEARITLLTSGGASISAKEVLHNAKWINNIDCYDTSNLNTLIGIKNFFKLLKSKNYDLLINLPNYDSLFVTQMRNMAFFKLSNIKCAGNFYISQIKIFAKAQAKYRYFPKEVDRLINGLPFDSNNLVEFPIEISENDKGVVCELLSAYRLDNKKNKIMAISFNGKGEAKHWPVENFIYVAKKWIENGGVVVFIGGISEKNEANRIVNEFKEGSAFNFAGLLTISQSMQLLECIELLLTIDTGTAHMASIMGTNCVEVFSSFDFPNCWVAYGNNVTVIKKDLDCSPCLKKQCKFGYPAKCMKEITANNVWNVVNNLYL